MSPITTISNAVDAALDCLCFALICIYDGLRELTGQSDDWDAEGWD